LIAFHPVQGILGGINCELGRVVATAKKKREETFVLKVIQLASD
jgi:hypothetical protein